MPSTVAPRSSPPLCASIGPGMTSPTAYTPGTVVSKRSFTAMRPCSSKRTPSSRAPSPRCAGGARPRPATSASTSGGSPGPAITRHPRSPCAPQTSPASRAGRPGPACRGRAGADSPSPRPPTARSGRGTRRPGPRSRGDATRAELQADGSRADDEEARGRSRARERLGGADDALPVERQAGQRDGLAPGGDQHVRRLDDGLAVGAGHHDAIGRGQPPVPVSRSPCSCGTARRCPA